MRLIQIGHMITRSLLFYPYIPKSPDYLGTVYKRAPLLQDENPSQKLSPDRSETVL